MKGFRAYAKAGEEVYTMCVLRQEEHPHLLSLLKFFHILRIINSECNTFKMDIDKIMARSLQVDRKLTANERDNSAELVRCLWGGSFCVYV